MKTWALVKAGVVLNTFIWDGEGQYQHDEDTDVIEYNDNNIAGPGYLYDGKAFSRPPITDTEQAVIDRENAESVSALKRTRMEEANEKISIIQDAVDLEMATSDEKENLIAWRKYRVRLERVDTANVQDIDWPEKPGA